MRILARPHIPNEKPKERSGDTINDIQCERCGRCLTVCPVYQQTRIETFSPRGRLELIRAVSTGELTPGDRYRQSIQSCLQCLACLNACPLFSRESCRQTHP